MIGDPAPADPGSHPPLDVGQAAGVETALTNAVPA